jgi:hypothetical protein
LSDIEYQADNTKATFYYSADDRVDFRELIKMLAGEFKIRVEMRQISLRQEAGRLGGIGVCGRELCCATWLTEFKNVATSAARYQNLSLNPSKLSGQCGRLKCCLNYELETYIEALEDIPKIEAPLQTEKGDAVLQKTDIFRRIMWFGYGEENTWHPLDIDRVNAILRLNREGKKPASLDRDESEEKASVEVLNSDLQRMDQKYKNKAKKKKKKKSGPGDRPEGKGEQRPQGQGQGQPQSRPQQSQGKQQGRRDQGQGQNKPQQPKGQQRPNNNPNRPNQNRPQQNRPNPNDNKPETEG